MSDDNIGAEAIAALGFFALALLAWPLRAWALVTCWGWFVVPLGVAPLGLAHAAGLLTIVALVRGGAASRVETAAIKQLPSDERRALYWRAGTSLLFAPVFAVAFAWAMHALMVSP